MPAIALVGSQWGDEGKGKIIDILAEKADLVVRAQGGNNAGHTVVTENETYKLRLIPSGILNPDCVCVLGNGCVIDPKALLDEMREIQSKNVSVKNLKIDYRAHVILPYHIALDGLAESARGNSDIGTTKRGIGPCYMDKTERSGIRFYDFINKEVFAKKLKEAVDAKNKIIVEVFGGKPFSYEEILNEYAAYADILREYAFDTSVIVYDAIKADKNVLFEGAQGTLLDLGMGTYPYVTSSHPTSGGFCTGAGIGPTLIDEVIGIAKAYTTRVGKGPFPTELFDEIGERIQRVGMEFGTVTGRSRRCGWLDLVILKYAVRVNGLTSIALNKLDTLQGISPLKVCVAYLKDGKVIEHFPADIDELKSCTPIYEELPGFDEDISKVRRYDDLPQNAKNYVEYIEKKIGCKISMVGVGPDRSQSLTR